MRLPFLPDPLLRACALIVVLLLSAVAAVTTTAWAATVHVIPFFASAAGSQQSFARIVNHSDESGTVQIKGIDDEGERTTGTIRDDD